jgi:peptidoglycan/LPS O-acetylase OafA/YrhL
MSETLKPLSATGDSLTPLRGVAACLVVVYHVLENYPVLQARAGLISEVIAKFYLWVDFFFILSGYVIAIAYGKGLESAQMTQRFHFLLLRIARLYPLHIVTLFAMILLDIAVASASGGSTLPFSLKSRSLATIPSHFLLIHSIGIHDGLSWNMPSWSISCEWVAYICFAFSSRFLMKIGRTATILSLSSGIVGYFLFCSTARRHCCYF